MATHDGLGARPASPSQIACEQLAVLGDGVVEPGDAIEREEPDAEGEGVVLVQGRLDERVVGTAVDVPVDALIELDQRPLVVASRRPASSSRSARATVAILRVRALGGEAGRGALEREASLGERGEVSDVDRRRRRSRAAG